MRKMLVAFEGLNVAAVLTHFFVQKIPLYNVERHGKQCKLTVSSDSVDEVVAYLQKKCYNVQVEKVGVAAALDFCGRRFVALLVAVAFVCAVCLANNFCLRIVVDGDVDRANVLAVLAENGVKVGCNLTKLDVDKTENALARMPDVVYAVVNRVGSTLYVQIVRSKHTETPVDLHKRHDIVSTADGEVTEVVCLVGTPCVAVGDKVAKGTALILGKRIYGDETTEDVYAMGRVTIKVSRSVYVPYSGVVTEERDTDQTFATNYVVLFGREYGKACPFELYRRTDTVTTLQPWNIRIVHANFVRVEHVAVPTPIEQVAETLKQQAATQLGSECDFEIAEITYDVTPSGITATAYGYVTVVS